MKLQRLSVSNFLGVSQIDVRLDQTVHLFAGPNGAGKSSVRDAVALALTADLGRVSLKKDAGRLVRAGQDAGICEVEDVDGDVYHVHISAAGKIIDSQKGRDTASALPYVLDAQRFARLDTTERRGFLFGLMGVKTGQAEIAARLKAKGCDDARVQRVLPLLRSGFDAACKQAKAYATEAKGAWRALTGETYGSEKAKTWRAHVPPYSAAPAREVATELQHCDVATEKWQQQVGKLQAEAERRAMLTAKLPVLLQKCERIDAITCKLETDEKSLAEWDADLAKTKTAAGGGPRVGLVHELAWAVHNLVFYGDPLDKADPDDQRIMASLEAYEAEHGPVAAKGGDGKAAARLPSIQHSRDLMARSVANDRRDLEAERQAKAEAEAIAAELAKQFDDSGLHAAKEQIDELKARRIELVRRSDELASIKAQVDAADKKTADAAKHAADVAAWDVIGDALSPDGIPGEILAEALGPFNERLAQNALDTSWPRVELTDDMEIRTGLHERPYALLSESEKWRCDAMLAEAIGHLSGVRMLVLDRFDVLDIPGRNDLLFWLDGLAQTGEVDTALLFGTLKAQPSGLPSTIATHWITDGSVTAQLKEAA